MKVGKLALLVILLTAVHSFGQSNSYRTLKGKFNDSPDVHSFSVGGWVCRMVVNLAGDYEFKKAIEDVQQVRLITIPQKEFGNQGVSVTGFKKILQRDSFTELAHIRDRGDDVTIYIRELSNKKNYYFVLIDDDREVVAIELKGYINPDILKDSKLVCQN